ncbi:MAG: hypothetical protein ACFFD1_05275, partial [Candidatus Thorarchaeota archaeon]
GILGSSLFKEIERLIKHSGLLNKLISLKLQAADFEKYETNEKINEQNQQIEEYRRQGASRNGLLMRQKNYIQFLEAKLEGREISGTENNDRKYDEPEENQQSRFTM